jgi:hypothetical protein
MISTTLQCQISLLKKGSASLASGLAVVTIAHVECPVPKLASGALGASLAYVDTSGRSTFLTEQVRVSDHSIMNRDNLDTPRPTACTHGGFQHM